jgi:cytochrome c oxidase subunit IV
MTETSIPHEHSPGNPDQHAGGAPHERFSEAEHPTHKGDHDPAHHNDPAHVRAEIRRYLIVLGALGVLTIITVAVAQLHLPTTQAILLALAVATVKGTLVAAFFMHLLSERKLIYAVLVLTVFFFGMMIWGPWHQRQNAEKSWPGYDLNASKPAPKAPAQPHGSQPQGSGH